MSKYGNWVIGAAFLLLGAGYFGINLGWTWLGYVIGAGLVAAGLVYFGQKM